MKNWKRHTLIHVVLVLMLNALAAFGQSTPRQTSSAPSSQRSDGDVSKKVASGESRVERKTAEKPLHSPFTTLNLIAACSAAVDELKAGRVLIDSLENENAVLKDRLDTELRTTAILSELNETRKSEAEALRSTVLAKNETISAKDAVITSQDKLIATLKAKKGSPWRRLGDVLLGAAAVLVLR